MPSFRRNRVAELLRQAISEIVVFEIKDPRVRGVTITEVQMSADLKSARVYFSCLADKQNEMHKKGLDSATPFIRRKLRDALDLKYIPELSFWYDSAFDHSIRIGKILKEINTSSNDD
jgi:ribosome-binding factor A